MPSQQTKLSHASQANAAALYPRRRGRVYAIFGLLLLFGVVVALAITIGSAQIPLSTTISILLSKLPLINITPDWTSSLETIILDIRLPRVILVGLVGAALAIAGATYQGLFRNPLADPYLIGVAQGAALGAVVGFLFPVNWLGIGVGTVPLLALPGR